jgi:type IV pilus assembly protein PilA
MLFLANKLRAQRRARLGSSCEEGAAEGGFTLIELMVVLLIMGILMAIAIPTFLGVTGSAKDKGAQSDTVNADTTAKVYYENHQSYTNNASMQKYLAGASHSITYVTCGAAASEQSNQVQVCSGPNAVEFISWSPTGLCWMLLDNQGPVGSSFAGEGSSGTYYGFTASSTAAGAGCNTSATGSPVSLTAYAATNPGNTAGTWYTSWPAAPSGQ